MSAGPAAPLEPPPEVARHPMVRAARELASEVLAPSAEEVDRGGLPASHVGAAARAGLLGLGAPASYGGTPVPAAVDREVTEILAGACGTTWFVLAQHRSPVRMLADAEPAVRDRWLPRLATGQALAGIAFTHVRRPGPPAVTARPSGGGWVLDGRVGWFTGWGLAEVVLVAGETGEGRLVFALVDAAAGPHLRSSGPLELAAMAGSRTASLELDGLAVGADRVVAVVDKPAWLDDDAAKTANATPAVFGLVRAVVAELDRAGERRDLPEARELASAVAVEAAELRARAYALVDEVPPGERLEERTAVRAHATELAVRSSAALVAAGAGGAMLLRSAAQRWAREALFHQVQAQTGVLRAAQLRRFLDVGDRAST